MLTTTGYTNSFTDLSKNSATTNQTRGLLLINQSIRYLVQKYFFNEQQYQTLTQAQVQVYTLPFDIKDIINETVLVGGILWQPLEAPNRQFWDSLNTIPFYSDFPQFSYRFKRNKLQLFPTPTSSNDPLQINYKRRIKDLSVSDYGTSTDASTVSVSQWKSGGLVATSGNSTLKATTLSYTPILAVGDTVTLTGPNTAPPTPFTANTTYYVKTVSASVQSISNPGNLDYTVILATGSSGGPAVTPTQSSGTAPMQGGPILSYSQAGNVVTGSGSAFTNNMEGRWLNIPQTTSNTTSGDDNWYEISSVQSTTQLTLMNDYQGNTASGCTYTIGETSILPEDYQDLALYRALWIYYTSIVPDAEQAKGYKSLYDQGKEVLDFEFGSKSTNPVLTPPTAPVFNPNFFPRITS